MVRKLDTGGGPSTQDSQLLKGALTLVLLALVAEEESYGLEIVGKVHALGLTDVPDGTIYPALHRLERSGAVTSRLVASSSGPARKYYSITPSGIEQLHAGADAWHALAGIISAILPKRTTKPTTKQSKEQS